MQLFKANTINQFKIGQWLIEQGITRDEIGRVEFLNPDTVKITAPWGAELQVLWKDGAAEIDQGNYAACGQDEDNGMEI